MRESNFNWVRSKSGSRGDHYAMHIKSGGEVGWAWRVFDIGHGWSTTFGWYNAEIKMGPVRGTLVEAKAAVEVAALALGHMSA